jgi:hypothetical protein
MNTNNDFSGYSDDDLFSEVSDFYKEIHGIRPRWVYGDRQAAIELYISLEKHMAWLRGTFEGREQMRDDGWVVEPETDPELIQKAAWLQVERDKRKAEFDALFNEEVYGTPMPAEMVPEQPMDRIVARQYVENGFV